jgi:hypothetical protein
MMKVGQEIYSEAQQEWGETPKGDDIQDAEVEGDENKTRV